MASVVAALQALTARKACVTHMKAQFRAAAGAC